MSAPRYTGNVPSNVSRDAKYSIVHGSGGMEIRLIFELSDGERALVTTRQHPKLVAMVNAVKEEHAERRGEPSISMSTVSCSCPV